jgi:nicotinamidase/pyrazinamidase
MTKKALVIVDVQDDFCSSGGYPVPEGEKVIGPLNKILAFARKNNWPIFASRDWHAKELFVGKESKTHCIQNTEGAKYHPDLDIGTDVTIISKGSTDLSNKHYSAFQGDEISLDDLLKQSAVEEVYIGGLATDYCVRSTALDSVNFGYTTFLLGDACRAINRNPGDEEKALSEMKNAGVIITNTEEIIKNL